MYSLKSQIIFMYNVKKEEKKKPCMALLSHIYLQPPKLEVIIRLLGYH
jgi:hypothetical protein